MIINMFGCEKYAEFGKLTGNFYQEYFLSVELCGGYRFCSAQAIAPAGEQIFSHPHHRAA